MTLVFPLMPGYAVVRLMGPLGASVLIVLALIGVSRAPAADQPQCFYRGEEEFTDQG
jgi:hypothetical protein